jgi:flagellar protein FlbD
MIRVTRLDRQEVVLNCDLIESIEARPDTTLRLVTGMSVVVREGVTEVLERIRAWRASVLSGAGLAGLLAQPAAPIPAARRESAFDGESDHAPLEIPA